MSAKESLLKTIRILAECLSDIALIDQAPGSTHNERASILRQGLAVLLFSTVETFIRDRTAEILRALTNKDLKFSHLSEALQKAATVGALEGVRFRLRYQPSVTKVPWLITNVGPIADAKTRNLSEMSFGYAASNLDTDDLRDILKAFGVLLPWAQMTKLSARLGLAVASCDAAFENIKIQRHSAAHALNSNVLHSDLTGGIRSSLAICLSFDLLLSECRRLTNRLIVPNVGLVPPVEHENVKLLFVLAKITSSGVTYSVMREQLPPPNRTIPKLTLGIFETKMAAVAFGRKHASKRQQYLIIMDITATPVDWVAP